MSAPPPDTALEKLPLSPRARVLHVLLGGLVLLGSAGLALLLGAIALDQYRAGARAHVLGLGSGLCALAAVWGALLVGRGARGYRRVSERGLRRDRVLRDASSVPGLALAMGCAAGLYLLTGGRPWAIEGFVLPTLLWHFCVGSLWLPLIVAVHELGHVAVAAALGIPWISLRIGPWELRRTGSGSRVRWHGEGLVFALGLAHLDAVALVATPTRSAWVMLGGVAGNVLLSGVQGALARGLGSPTPFEAQGVTALLWAGALLNGLLAVNSLVPRRLATGIQSDGAQWLALRRLGRASRGAQLLGRVQAESATRRPREWSTPVESLMDAARAPGEPPEVAGSLSLYALAIHLDRAEFAAARALLDSLGPVPPSTRDWLRFEFRLQDALMRALCDADAPRARALLDAAGTDPSHPGYPLLTHAAVLLAEDRRPEALQALTQWDEAARAGGLAQWLSGNQWAVERLHAALGLPDITPDPSSNPKDVSP